MPRYVRYDTFALDAVNRAQETRYFQFKLPPTALRQGRNVLAVEIHQNQRASSDLGFDMELRAKPLNLEALVPLARLGDIEQELKLPNDLRVLLRHSRAKMLEQLGEDDQALAFIDEALSPSIPRTPDSGSENRGSHVESARRIKPRYISKVRSTQSATWKKVNSIRLRSFWMSFSANWHAASNQRQEDWPMPLLPWI